MLASELNNALMVVEMVPVETNSTSPAAHEPEAFYLASIAKSSSRVMLDSLKHVASLLSVMGITAWHEVRNHHAMAVRAQLAETCSAAMANRHLCALAAF